MRKQEVYLMLDETKATALFVDYYAQWVQVYKEGAIREVTLAKYKMTQAWLKKLVPELQLCNMTRITYQQLINEKSNPPAMLGRME